MKILCTKFRTLIFLMIVFGVIGCRIYVQVFDTSSINTKTNDGFYTYETSMFAKHKHG